MAGLLGLQRIGASFRMSAWLFIADPQWLIPSSIAPVIFALSAFEMYRAAGPGLVLEAVLGAGMMSMWGQTLYGSGFAIAQDRLFRTLEATLVTSAPYFQVVTGRVLWNAVSGLFGGGVVLGVVELLGPGRLSVEDPVTFIALYIGLIAALAVVGLLLSSLFVLSRYGLFVQNFGEFALYLGTGCMFPIVLLPNWSNPLSLMFPPTWALDALRFAAIPGYVGLPWGLLGDVAGTGGTALIYLVAARYIFRLVERHVGETGDLDFY